MANEITIPYSLDDYFAAKPIGAIDSAIGNYVAGYNHRQIPVPAINNKETYGLTFFTRPQLNLTSANIRAKRQFYGMLSNQPVSVQRMVRMYLDPRMGNPLPNSDEPALKSPIVTNTHAFIPLLTNSLVSMSGWPDMNVPHFTSKKGLYGESVSMVDGPAIDYTNFSLSCTFRNILGDPTTYLFYVWLHYMASVFEGVLMPYPDFIVQNEIDYNTRIYRLVLDQQKKHVVKIAATGAAFPVSLPTSSYFDYNTTNVYNDQNREISVQFNCSGAMMLDDILVKTFNMTSGIFNPEMRKLPGMEMFRIPDSESSVNTRSNSARMFKIDYEFLHLFNYQGYPYINPDTYELEWWIMAGTNAADKYANLGDLSENFSL